jgi:flagellar protein FlbT
MALKITLKPHEKMIVGGAVVKNGGATAHLVVENKVPVLRERDIIGENGANTPCRRIYFAVQLMYIDADNRLPHHNAYWRLVRELVEAVPAAAGLVEPVSQQVLVGDHYKALKAARKLIEFEQEVTRRVPQSL